MKVPIPAPGAGFGTVRTVNPGRPRKAGRRTRLMPGFVGIAASPAMQQDGYGAAAPRSRGHHYLRRRFRHRARSEQATASRNGLDQFGEIAVQRFFVAALDQDLVAVAKDQRTKPVPLWFENPCSPRRYFGNSLGEHRQDRRINRKIHALDRISYGYLPRPGCSVGTCSSPSFTEALITDDGNLFGRRPQAMLLNKVRRAQVFARKPHRVGARA